MVETPEIDELAKRYLDLWQEHLSGMTADPDLSASMTRLFAAFLSPVKEGDPADAVGGGSEITGSETGTRPLSTHLLTAALTYATSNAALPLLKSGSLNWKAALDDWISQVAEVDNLELTAAVERESRRRLAAFLEGVKAYRNNPYRRTLPEPAVTARDGSSRLLEFSASGADDGPAFWSCRRL